MSFRFPILSQCLYLGINVFFVIIKWCHAFALQKWFSFSSPLFCFIVRYFLFVEPPVLWHSVRTPPAVLLTRSLSSQDFTATTDPQTLTLQKNNLWQTTRKALQRGQKTRSNHTQWPNEIEKIDGVTNESGGRWMMAQGGSRSPEPFFTTPGSKIVAS